MKVLILYATYTGSTAQAASVLERIVKREGHEVTLREVSEVTSEELVTHDVLLLGSPSWGNGEPHLAYAQLQEQYGEELSQKTCAIFGLGDSSFPEFCKAVDVLEEMVQKFNGQLLSPSLRIDRYLERGEEVEKDLTTWVQTLFKKQ